MSISAILSTSLFLFIILALILVGCSKQVTKEEAETIAREYILSRVGSIPPGESVAILNTYLQNENWHVQIAVGDDKATILVNNKGKVVDYVTYE